MAEDKHSLPDISGVFDIDESRIPSKIIEKPVETKPTAPTESILLKPETRAEEKRIEKERKATVKQKKKTARMKALKKNVILVGIAAVLLLAAVLGIRGMIKNRNMPQVLVSSAKVETLTSHYDTEGTILKEDPDKDDSPYYAVFVENDYDVYGLQKGQRATVTISEEVSVTGVVQDIRKEESDSNIIERLKALFTGGSFSTAANITVYISLDDADYAADSAQVQISVVTGISEDAVTVPTEALHKDESGQHYVWVYKSSSKKVKRQDVTVGLETDGVSEIKRGLSEGDFVVTDVVSENKELYNNAKVKLGAAG